VLTAFPTQPDPTNMIFRNEMRVIGSVFEGATDIPPFFLPAPQHGFYYVIVSPHKNTFICDVTGL
jgi:hypothetical protein